MQIGAMNHPMRDVVAEISGFREMGFDFVDLTLEPARAQPGVLDVAAVAAALAGTGLGVVGHTAWFLPIASSFDRVRQAALDELTSCLDVFARLQVRRVNVHPDQRVSLYDREWVIERNADALRFLVARAAEREIQLMAENVPGLFNTPETLRRLLDAVPGLAWHLDVGHANLGAPRNQTERLLESCGDRLVHVHLSDNKGGDADLHLPLGAGTIDWRWVVDVLRRFGYDGTITLEVFSPDPEYLALSRRKLRRWWDEGPAPAG
ncbi:MAG: sugar phosphate isomerase/epimerase family protein [Chloroflexota bacterium]